MHLNISPCNTGARLDAHIQTHTQEVTSSGTYCMIRIHRSIEPWTFKLFLIFIFPITNIPQDIVAPSDMMDGRVRAIKEILAKNNLQR